jgi:cell division protein FtsX
VDIINALGSAAESRLPWIVAGILFTTLGSVVAWVGRWLLAELAMARKERDEYLQKWLEAVTLGRQALAAGPDVPIIPPTGGGP